MWQLTQMDRVGEVGRNGIRFVAAKELRKPLRRMPAEITENLAAAS
jgi:hypothetical protein